MAENILPGTIHRSTEFVNGLTGACGPNALSMGTCWSSQLTAADTYGVYTFMRARGLCQSNGASTIDALNQAAQALGYTVAEYRGYGEPWTDWRAFFGRHVGTSYILMETANGQALRDAISGNGENATNLRYHFIGIVGHHDGGYSARAGRDLPAGWWAVDGDNYAQGDVLQFYPDAVLAAAQPCGALALVAKVRPVSMAWHRNGDGTATDDQGHHAMQGLAALILARHAASNGLCSETPYDGARTFVALSDGAVVNWDGNAAHDDTAAQVLMDVWGQLQTAKARPTTTTTDNPLADKALAQMQALKELLTEV